MSYQSLILIIILTILCSCGYENKESPTEEVNKESLDKDDADRKTKNLSHILKSTDWHGEDSIENAYSEKLEWYDKQGILHWDVNYKKSPLILTFYEDSAVLEAPKLTAYFELASIVHTHGTTLSTEKKSRFVYDYEVNENDSSIVLDGDLFANIELQFKNGVINWPLWRMNDSLVFRRMEK